MSSELIEPAEEHRLPGIPREQSVDDLPSLANELCWNADDRVEKRLELHSKHISFGRSIFGAPPTLLWKQQPEPGFQAPGKRRHHHVGPVTLKIIQWGFERMNTTLELSHQVLLITAFIRLPNDLSGRHSALVRKIEKVNDVVEQTLLASLHR